MLVRAPEKCLRCVFLSTMSGTAYCPFPVCLRDKEKGEGKMEESGEKERD